jgi:3-phosphoshikimate 1-carboxyvinyltransferase
MHAERLGLEGTDRISVLSSLSEQTGFLYGMWLALALGVPQVIYRECDPRRTLRLLQEWRGTFAQAPTETLVDLLKAAQSSLDVHVPLRLIVPIGPCLPPELTAWARKSLQLRICGGFGTPGGCLAALCAPTDPPDEAAGSQGRALPGVELRICDGEGHPVAPGEEGYLEISSSSLNERYAYKAPPDVLQYAPDIWHRGGEAAVLDPSGYLHVAVCHLGAITHGDQDLKAAQVNSLV